MMTYLGLHNIASELSSYCLSSFFHYTPILLFITVARAWIIQAGNSDEEEEEVYSHQTHHYLQQTICQLKTYSGSRVRFC